MSVEIVFETHATTNDNEAGIATGWLPGKLSPTGRIQAGELGERRRDDGISVVFTSDLFRAGQTASWRSQDRRFPSSKTSVSGNATTAS